MATPAPSSPDPTSLLMLAVLGVGAYLLFMRQAQAGTGTAYTAGRTYLQSPAVASGASSTGALGGIITGLGNLFKTNNTSTGGSPTLMESLNTWTRIENANNVDPLYRAGLASSGQNPATMATSGGDDYGSNIDLRTLGAGVDAVASNPSPLMSWDSWFTGTGGMGD